MNQEPTVFTRIIARELPADILFEDEDVIVIRNINPQAPIHLLGISKKPFFGIHELASDESNKDVLWGVFSALGKVASDLGLDEKGYRLVTNNGPDANQSVPHFHVHLLGGTKLSDL